MRGGGAAESGARAWPGGRPNASGPGATRGAAKRRAARAAGPAARREPQRRRRPADPPPRPPLREVSRAGPSACCARAKAPKDRFSPAGARGRRRRWSRARPGARGRRCTVTLNSGAPGQGAPGLSPQPSRLGSGGLSPRESRRLPPSPREDIQVRQNPLQRGEREPDKRAWSAAQ